MKYMYIKIIELNRSIFIFILIFALNVYAHTYVYRMKLEAIGCRIYLCTYV